MVLIASLVFGALAARPEPAAGAVLAFPGAEGFGAAAVGGRGGQVFIVSNLNDSGSGSLRECVSASGPRTCVFSVSGRIVLATPLLIDNPYLTIAGQTAPGNGITLSAGPNITRGIVIIRTHDVIMRYIALRPGLNANQQLVENEYNIDALTIGDYNREPYNVIIDHVSMAWATDEILNTARKHHGITIQWSIMSEVVDCDGDPTNNKCGGKGPLFHTGTGDQRGGSDISFHHNLLSSNQGRNPMVKNAGGITDIVNNVIFPTTRQDGTAITTILDSTHGDINLNYVGNYIIGDPARLNDQRYVDFLGLRLAYPHTAGRLGVYRLYVSGNIGPMRPSNTCPGLSTLQCELLIINPVHVDQRQWNQRGAENLNLDSRGNLVRHPAPLVTTHDAFTAYELVLASAGKSQRLNADGTWVAYRDPVDAKIIADVRNHRAVQLSGQPWPPSASAWPAGTNVPSYPDTDRDGMSDIWEQMHFGTLSRGSATDSSSDFDNDGYTDLEEFLNGTNPRSGSQSPAATQTQAATATRTPAASATQPPRTPTQVSPTATNPARPTQTPVPTQLPTNSPPTEVPPATVPPTEVPPTEVPPTEPSNTGSPGHIWGSGFESGDLSGWAESQTDGGDLSVTSAAALEGAWGLQALIDDRSELYVTDESPAGETHYRVRFAFDPNSTDVGRGNDHALFHGYGSDGRLIIRLQMRWASGGYQLRIAAQNDRGRWTNSDWIALSDEPHRLEMDWLAAPDRGGHLRLWLDGTEVASVNGLDNDTHRLERVSLGLLGVEDGSISGAYYFDAFDSER